MLKKLPFVPTFLFATLALGATGCFFEFEGEYVPLPPPPPAIEYEMCYADADCVSHAYCTELAIPALDYGEYVNAICTVGCFDDLDCPVSEFNGLPGACIPHDVVGGHDPAGVCVERCEFDSDCDEYGGFACQFWFGERLCLPIQ